MSDEYKLNAEAARGMQAAALLENSLLIEAYNEIEAGLIDGWINSDPRDTDGRERVWHAIHANRKHKNYLQLAVGNGKIAAAELTELAKQN